MTFELSRREICWLIKDRLLRKGKQKGWSFIRAQVEPKTIDDLRQEFSSMGFGAKLRNEELSAFGKTGNIFGVSLYDKIDINHLKNRLVYCDKIAEMDSGRITLHSCDKQFWTREMLEFWSPRRDEVECTIFNIINPYQGVMIADLNTERLIDIRTKNIATFEDKDISSLSITCTKYIIETSNLKELTQIVNRVSKFLLPGSMRGRRAMDTLGLETGALTGAVALFEFEETNTANIPIFLELADRRGLSIHLYLSDPTTQITYVGLRNHQIDSLAKRMEGKFDGKFEIRKFKLVEYIRNHLPGHKGPEGIKDTVWHVTKNGWEVHLHRPGYKDCEDFYIELIQPKDISKSLTFSERDPKPIFEKIFREAKLHFQCPKTGKAFADAVWEIWQAERNITEIIVKYLQKLEGCTTNISYDTEGFLLMIHYIFVVEDMNYRFWYHPPIRGLMKRKLGRNLPMNCLIQVLAGNDFPLESMVKNLIPRPSRFQGPKHLESWFKLHIARNKQHEFSISN